MVASGLGRTGRWGGWAWREFLLNDSFTKNLDNIQSRLYAMVMSPLPGPRTLAALLTLLALVLAVPVARAQPPVPSWEDIDALVKEEKFQAAIQGAEARLAQARERGNEDEWARALLLVVQLRMGQGEVETSVRFLREQPWPNGLLPRTALNLHYAGTLISYVGENRGEVRRREQVVSGGLVDLKLWTEEQIYTEVRRALAEAWKERARLGAEKVGVLAGFLAPNTYPPGIRDTMRDAVSYFWVELLADQEQWGEGQVDAVYRLDLDELLTGTPQVDLVDPSVHPLRKLAAVLGDLEAWHLAAGRREAALEAHLHRAQMLFYAFQAEEDDARIRRHVAEHLEGYRDVPWWAMGQGWLAETEQSANRLVRAHALAKAGAEAFPESLGGKRCARLVKRFEAPEFSLSSMRSDGARKRSLLVVHQNVPRLHFRAYSYDLESRLATGNLYDGLAEDNEDEQGPLRRILERERPVASWSEVLPGTPDFREHQTFVVPPLTEPGSYLILASAHEDFREADNRVAATLMTVTPWVFVRRDGPGSRVEVRVMEGETGQPVAGVEVRMVQSARVNRVLRSLKTDAQGEAVFESIPGRGLVEAFIAVGRGRRLLLDPDMFYTYGGRAALDEEEQQTQVLVYTDRSVYRPLQKVQWKVVAFRGSKDQARYRTLPRQRLTVSLVDAGFHVVEKREVRTNDFGSVAGEFLLPAGKRLGRWRVDVSAGRNAEGSAAVRVEEYKRPTFEVTLKDSDETPRLDRPATFRGEARYFFGLPVTRGTVRWRVRREPVFPSWWRRGELLSRERVLASGTSSLAEDGGFQLTFTPESDTRAGAAREASWRYRVEADVTDEGGETRSASRSFRLGQVAVEGRVDMDGGFFREGVPAEVRLTRSNLDGVPLPGAGRWRLVALKQPAQPVMPSELPASMDPEPPGAEDEWVTTPGDLLRTRWERGETDEQVLRAWAEGEELKRGSVTHDAQGLARVALPALRPGTYRLHYETEDALGERFITSREVLVVGERAPIALPALLRVERSTVRVGEVARVLAFSGFEGQPLFLDVLQDERLVQRYRLIGGKDPAVLELPVTESLRGGFTLSLVAVRDYQVLRFTQSVTVPFDNKELHLEFSTFRDRLRPGAKETWRVTVKGPRGEKVDAGAAELLAYMYDRSLDVFASHQPPRVTQFYPQRSLYVVEQSESIGRSTDWTLYGRGFGTVPEWKPPKGDLIVFEDGYGGGPGRRDIVLGLRVGAFLLFAGLGSADAEETVPTTGYYRRETIYILDGLSRGEPAFGINHSEGAGWDAEVQSGAVRANFAETAFWVPQLLTGEDGSAVLEFTVPDSVTAWNVWVHALTRDLKGGSLQREARSVKELMVRPYVPRFLREGDRAVLEVLVNNAGETTLEGSLVLDIVDPETDASLLSRFGVESARQPFRVEAGKGATVRFPLTAPAALGPVAFRVTAKAGDFSDGELRPLPVLPGRMHLAQSRFVALRGGEREEMEFADLRRGDDPSLLNEQLVVTVDAQPFHAVLGALPYLVDYPYECTEQTLNRFVSTGIVSSLYGRYPEVAKLAKSLSTRPTRFEPWDAGDPNRKMSLEESPWLEESQGGRDEESTLVKVLDPQVAKAAREAALEKLRQAQTSSGAFPWWPGGPPSPYMTLYILHGLARAAEHGVEMDRRMTTQAWEYLAKHFRSDYAQKLQKEGCCWEFLTLLEYVASSFPDASYTGNALTPEERARIRDYSFEHWREHSPYLKGYLALALKRAGRVQDARRVFESVMDSAKTSEELGTYWAPEERSWLWYNDTTETHAFALRTLLELNPKDERRHGLAQWLLLDRKLGHWKSTRATAEAVYALVKYLEREGTLGVREDVKVTAGGRTVGLSFAPEVYTGKGSRVVVPGPEVKPETGSTVVVEKTGKGLAFASATWHFSTERLPEEERGDFFHVSRRYFLREQVGTKTVLRSLEEGTPVVPGDEVEVQLSLRTKHAAEYVHLRDPRAAGLEPTSTESRHRYDLGIIWYEEPRDSGTNFFFEWLPAGEYTFRYRLKANMAGTFRVGPATVQSMYAPEFTAYSKGAVLSVGGR